MVVLQTIDLRNPSDVRTTVQFGGRLALLGVEVVDAAGLDDDEAGVTGGDAVERAAAVAAEVADHLVAAVDFLRVRLQTALGRLETGVGEHEVGGAEEGAGDLEIVLGLVRKVVGRMVVVCFVPCDRRDMST